MAEEVQPARRPGRPRKTVAPAAEKPAVADKPAADKPAIDALVGSKVPETWTSLTYADGRSYLCKNGKITERVH